MKMDSRRLSKQASGEKGKKEKQSEMRREGGARNQPTFLGAAGRSQEPNPDQNACLGGSGFNLLPLYLFPSFRRELE